MLTVKLKADDVKRIKAAMSESSDDWLSGLSLIVTRIEEAETLKEISKGKKAQEYTWKDAQA
ncbi:MAG TPA: hypothetical protein VIY48_08735, partial [Candidatus Paceibacterota bacterium]